MSHHRFGRWVRRSADFAVRRPDDICQSGQHATSVGGVLVRDDVYQAFMTARRTRLSSFTATPYRPPLAWPAAHATLTCRRRQAHCARRRTRAAARRRCTRSAGPHGWTSAISVLQRHRLAPTPGSRAAGLGFERCAAMIAAALRARSAVAPPSSARAGGRRDDRGSAPRAARGAGLKEPRMSAVPHAE